MRGALLSFLRNRSGSAAVEFALVLPMLLALTFVMFEGGHYLYIQHQVVKGVRDGARFASRQAFTNYTCTTIDGSVANQIKNVTRTGSVSGGTPRVPGWGANANDVQVLVSCPATAVTTGIYQGLPDGNAPRVMVWARVPYTSLFSAIGTIRNTSHVGAYQQAAVVGL